MAEAKETVLIEIDIEQEDSFTKLADLKGTLAGLKQEQKDLQKALKDGIITQKEYNNEIVRVEALQKKAQAQYNQTQRSVTGLKNPITELNSTIQKNNQLTEQQTKLFGGAIPALDKLTGGAASAAQGIYGMVRASIAFIATPIGAVVTALGIAIGALTLYFKGSEEGEDRFARISAFTTVVLNQLRLVVEALGEAIFESGNSFDTMTKKLGIFGVALDISLAPIKLLLAGLQKIAEFTGLDKVIEDTKKISDAIAALNDKIEADENKLIVRRAETNKQVQELREQAIRQEGKQKEETIAKAIALEKELAQVEKQHLIDKLNAFDKEAATTGRLTEEQKKKRAELSAAIIDAESQGAQATIRFQKELEALRDKEHAAYLKKIEDRKKARQDELKQIAQDNRDIEAADKEQFETNLKFVKNRTDERLLVTKTAYQQGLIDKEQFEDQMAALEIQGLEERKKFLINNGQETLEIDTAIVDAKIKNAEREKNSKAKIAAEQNAIERQKLTTTATIADAANAITKKGTLAYKATASSQATIDTYAAANAAVKPPPIGLGPVAGIPLAILTVIKGLLNVAKINDIGFARGGAIRPNNGIPINRPNGDNRLITAFVGETVVTPSQVSRIGANRFAAAGVPGYATGGIVGNEVRSASRDIERQFSNPDTVFQPVLVLEQFELKQTEVNNNKNRAVVISG